MKAIKLSFILKIGFGIYLVFILFMIALNGRYESLSNGYILDKWKCEVYHIGTEEMPLRINGTINNR